MCQKSEGRIQFNVSEVKNSKREILHQEINTNIAFLDKNDVCHVILQSPNSIVY